MSESDVPTTPSDDATLWEANGLPYSIEEPGVVLIWDPEPRRGTLAIVNADGARISRDRFEKLRRAYTPLVRS
ncbi:MAG TPA: hypothetical protein VLK36_10530 [Gaiellaceae bacterium]|nr:hypothetical protein [Gaiellaceae bacterium]